MLVTDNGLIQMRTVGTGSILNPVIVVVEDDADSHPPLLVFGTVSTTEGARGIPLKSVEYDRSDCGEGAIIVGLAPSDERQISLGQFDLFRTDWSFILPDESLIWRLQVLKAILASGFNFDERSRVRLRGIIRGLATSAEYMTDDDELRDLIFAVEALDHPSPRMQDELLEEIRRGQVEFLTKISIDRGGEQFGNDESILDRAVGQISLTLSEIDSSTLNQTFIILDTYLGQIERAKNSDHSRKYELIRQCLVISQVVLSSFENATTTDAISDDPQRFLTQLRAMVGCAQQMAFAEAGISLDKPAEAVAYLQSEGSQIGREFMRRLEESDITNVSDTCFVGDLDERVKQFISLNTIFQQFCLS
ncbi:hypothetical protein [Pseudoroseicyclus aestuarii]|nr:hypothetical protein [Pseudoroseicyclus aestuarii]